MDILENIKILTGNKILSTSPSPPKKKVLIVEDENSIADPLAIKLTEAGFEVLKATNGKEGLEIAKSQKIAIILLDLLMPVMTGKQMLHDLRNTPEGKTIPVIVLTNQGDVDSMRETWLYEDAREFLVKSNISMDEIVTKVESITREK